MIKPAILLLALTCGVASGAIINSAGVDYISVSNAVALAHPGDIVQLPAGTNGWWNTILVSGITLQGAGTNSTKVTDETPVIGGVPMMLISTVSNFQTRVTGIQFSAGVTNNISTFPNNSSGNIQIGGAAPKWRIDHCTFTLLSGKSILLSGDTYGLIDDNYFHTFNRISVQSFGSGYGDEDWASTITFGSSNATYVESNVFKDDNNFGWIDIASGGRLVFRYNTCDGFYLNTHGPDEAPRFRGVRYLECYMNTMTHTAALSPGSYNNFYTGVDIRGGTGIIFSNTFSTVYAPVLIRDYRSTDNSPNFSPWWGATGLTNWDSNGGQLLAGNALGGTNNYITTNDNVNNIWSWVLTVSNATWTANQWVGCTVFNYASNKMGTVTANNATTMFFNQQGFHQFVVGFKNGDQFTLHKIYPMLDGCGMGKGLLLTGDNPVPQNLAQQSEPIYNWSNIHLQQENGFLIGESPNVVNNYPSILEGRQYTNSPLAGFVPFTYPFPNDTSVPVIPNSFTYGAFKL